MLKQKKPKLEIIYTLLNYGLIAWLSSCIINLDIELENVDFSKVKRCYMAAPKISSA